MTRHLLAAAAVIAAAACGTTVPQAARVSAPAGSLQEPAGGAADVASSPAPGQSGRQPTRSDGTPAAGGVGSPVAGVVATPVPTAVPDSSRITTPIQIGIFITKNASTFYDSAGLSAVSLGDTQKVAQLVVDEVNRTGGIAGRKVVPVWAVIDATSTTPADQQEQAACSTWTEDAHVFAAVSPLENGNGPLMACLQRRGVAFLQENEVMFDDGDFAQRSLLYTPGMVSGTRAAAIYADRLQALGYFDKGTRLGIVRDDTEQAKRAVADQLRPGLRRAGITPVEEAVVPYPAAGDQVAQVQNIVLRFKAENIDHILFFESGAGAALYFMPAAEAQAYRPRYALTSYDGPNVLAATVPAAQLARAVGVGWYPATDANDGLQHVNAGGKRCLDLMAKGGQSPTSGTAALVAFTYCDGLFLLQQALKGAAATADNLRTGTRALGSTFLAGRTYATDFSSGRRDGASLERDVRFDVACSCFVFAGGTRALP